MNKETEAKDVENKEVENKESSTKRIVIALTMVVGILAGIFGIDYLMNTQAEEVTEEVTVIEEITDEALTEAFDEFLKGSAEEVVVEEELLK